MQTNQDTILPANFKLQYSSDQIQSAVKQLGKGVTIWSDLVWKNSHTDILAIPILRGAIFFFADLVREIKRSVEIAPARTWAYEDTENNLQRTEVRVHMEDVPTKGRSVLLVDDICDSGRTLKVLRKTLLEAGAIEVKSAVLVKRVIGEDAFEPDWVGFHYTGPEWMVGYGMDDCDKWRNLPYICVIKQS